MKWHSFKTEGAQTSFRRYFCAWLKAARLCIIGLALMVCWPYADISPTAGTADGSEQTDSKTVEYKVKAAFIYNFTKFVVWPTEKKSNSSNEPNEQAKDAEKVLCIGIVGRNPFGDAFVPVINKEGQSNTIKLVEIESFANFQSSYTQRSEAVEAYRKTHAATLETCAILFFCDSEKPFMNELLSLVNSAAILTVSDVPDFAASGGMIGFVEENNKIRFEVNLKAAQKTAIKISSQLLGLARQVYK